MKPLAAIFCGDRHWSNRQAVYDTASKYYAKKRPGDVLIEGDAPGAERIAGEAADFLGIRLAAFPADWDRHHRAAGPIRNRQMLDYLLTFEDTHRLRVVAFHDDLPSSKGTKNMVMQARKKGVSCTNVRHRGG